MVYTTSNLPENYTPYEEVDVCSNRLIGGVQLVAISEHLPLIVGKGSKPQIWLQGITNPEKVVFTPLVENSIPKHPAIEVKEVADDIIVSAFGTTMLKVKVVSPSHVVIGQLDLRPIGINVFGDSNTLTVAGNEFSDNTMEGNPSTTLIGMN